MVMEVMSGREKEKREERQKLERDINIFYCINILF